jgi:hypothetical protein
MDVESIETKQYQVVQVQGVNMFRYAPDDWRTQYQGAKVTPPIPFTIAELEELYQQYLKNHICRVYPAKDIKVQKQLDEAPSDVFRIVQILHHMNYEGMLGRHTGQAEEIAIAEMLINKFTGTYGENKYKALKEAVLNKKSCRACCGEGFIGLDGVKEMCHSCRGTGESLDTLISIRNELKHGVL